MSVPPSFIPSIPSLPLPHLFIVICSLFNTAQISLHFDPSLILLTWKAVGKLVCRLRDHTHCPSDNEWSLSSVVCGICDAMKQKSRECVKCASQKDKVNMYI